MTDSARLRSLILSLDGVHTVYPADPAWKTTARRVRNALTPEDRPTELEYVRLRNDTTSKTLMVRVGADGTVPTTRLARAIAAALRAALDDDSAPGPLKITVEISSIRYPPATPGTAPAP
ncbi:MULTISPECIES: hypothetical protein [unclassified Arthrobacter]|uniref:hypothetical protein n=1 Tax=unclassified Arthrobacter TaxID=235627 RepID=UPI002DFD8CB7|nr:MULTISPECIES: hypothetical protein [unclassified Arthrobacter]MEC5191885.1 hypothetical protein [Arthrobacter sp. MP_M4]MEC5202390.1 hypothetical protein [Arthrobacter sp. MP_M7]